MLIDTHVHLYSEDFDLDRPQVVMRAKNAGVSTFLLPAIDSSTHAAMKKTKQDYPEDVHLMMGLHPCSVNENTVEEELSLVKKELEQNPYIAVGEIGIDLYWRQDNLLIQQDAFLRQVKWAKEMNLPICIHARNSLDEVLEILTQEKDATLRGVMHCFSGDKCQARQFIDYNFKLGIGGVITFKNSDLHTTLASVPLEKIILETDAPYLAPTPYRGKRNESSYLGFIVEKLASLYQTDHNSIIEQTTKNAKEIFKLS